MVLLLISIKSTHTQTHTTTDGQSNMIYSPEGSNVDNGIKPSTCGVKWRMLVKPKIVKGQRIGKVSTKKKYVNRSKIKITNKWKTVTSTHFVSCL